MEQRKKVSGWLISGFLALFAPFICCLAPILALIFGAGAAASAIAFTGRYSGLFFALAAVLLGYAAWKLFYKKTPQIGQPVRQLALNCPQCGHQNIVTMPAISSQQALACAHCGAQIGPLARSAASE